MFIIYYLILRCLVLFQRNGFATDVMPIVTSIVAATIDVYHSAMKQLLPTPQKSHYIFNLRDLSHVMSGHLLIKKESIESKKVFIK